MFWVFSHWGLMVRSLKAVHVMQNFLICEYFSHTDHGWHVCQLLTQQCDYML